MEKTTIQGIGLPISLPTTMLLHPVRKCEEPYVSSRGLGEIVHTYARSVYTSLGYSIQGYTLKSQDLYRVHNTFVRNAKNNVHTFKDGELRATRYMYNLNELIAYLKTTLTARDFIPPNLRK